MSVPIVTRISDFYDRNTGASVAANGDASEPSFSANGLLVAFTSTADNIASPYLFGGTAEADGDGAVRDVYVHMLNGGDNTLLSGEQNGIFDVVLPNGALRYSATSHSAVFSPVSEPAPNGTANSTLQWLAFVTDSAGGQYINTANGPLLTIPYSDGSRDIAIANIVYDSNSPVHQANSHTFGFNLGFGAQGVFVVEDSADVTGTPAFSGNGRWLGFAAGEAFQADFDGFQVRLLEVHDPANGATVVLRADAPIGNVALSQDGSLVAFDSAADAFDLDGDGIFELAGLGLDGNPNAFVLDRNLGTLIRLTDDQATSPAFYAGARVAGFLPDPLATQPPTLLVDSVADPVGGAPLPRSQAIQYTLAAGVWTGAIVSTNLLGAPAGSTDVGTQASDLAQPLGTPWAAMLSHESDLPGAPPAAQNLPDQGWVGGVGLAPQLVTPGDPLSGMDGANAAIESLMLSPLAVASGAVTVLAGQGLPTVVPLLAYATQATNLLGATPTVGGHSSVYVATFDAPRALPPRIAGALDYTVGGALNPLVNGSASITHLDLDATQDRIDEHGPFAGGVTTISARLGRPYLTDQPLTIVNAPSGTLTLAGGDDLVVGLPTNVVLDGGGGVDTVRIPAGTQLDAFMGDQTLVNIERLQFDPATAPDQFTEARLTAWQGVMPVPEVIGSPGPDQLRVDVVDFSGGTATLDLRTIHFTNWALPPGGSDRVYVDANAATSVVVYAHPDAPMRYTGVAQGVVFGSAYDDVFQGGDEADRFEGGAGSDFASPGPGVDRFDGGAGRDMISYAGQYAALPRPAPVFVDLADGLAEHGGAAEGDVLIGVEDLWGSPDSDELRGDAQANQIDGWEGDDLVEGRGGDDKIWGNLGNDTIAGGAGDDILDGMDGDDTAVFNGNRAEFAAAATGFSPTSVRITDQRPGSPEGHDFVSNVEHFRFNDGTFTLAQLLAPQLTVIALASATVPHALEGSTGAPAGMLSFEITRAGDLSGTTSVTLRVAGGDAPSASADDVGVVRTAAGTLGTGLGDYTVTFAPGQTQITVEVLTQPDDVVEPIESVRLTLLSATGGLLDPSGVLSAQGLVLNDDLPPVPPPVFELDPFGFPSAAEGTAPGTPAGVLDFVLKRSSGDLQTAATLTVELASDEPLSAELDDIASVGGTGVSALGGGRYSVDFPAGAQQVHLLVTPAADALDEPDESVTFNLVSTTAGSIGPFHRAQATILDDDLPPVPPPVFELDPFGFPSAAEGTAPGTPAGVLDFVLKRSSGDLQTAATLTVELASDEPLSAELDDIASVGGAGVSALGNGRYSVDFPAGAQQVHLLVTPAADALDEPDESVTFNLVSTTAGSIGPFHHAQATILDDDLPPVPPPVFELDPFGFPSAAEGTAPGTPAGVLDFVLKRSSGDLQTAATLTVELASDEPLSAELDDIASVGGTGVSALGGGRYSVDFPAGAQQVHLLVTPAADALDEPDESVTFNLVSTTAGSIGPFHHAQATILDDDLPPVPPPVFELDPFGFPSAAEGTAPGTPAGVLDFVLKRSSGDLQTAATLTVELASDEPLSAELDDIASVGGTGVSALGGGRYSVDFPAGAQQVHLLVTPAADALDEPDESVTFNLVSTTAGSIGFTGYGTAKILDDDLPPVPPKISIGGPALIQVTEGSAPAVMGGQAQVIFERTGDLSHAATVSYELRSPALVPVAEQARDSDLIGGLGGLRLAEFAVGQSQVSVAFDIVPDLDVEANEMFEVEITGLRTHDARFEFGTQRTATVTILNDDSSIEFKTASASVDEGNPPDGVKKVVLQRTGDLSGPASATWRVDADAAVTGTPITADDVGQTLGQDYTTTFQPGQAEVEIDVLVVPDQLHEPDEGLHLTLTAVSGSTLGATTSSVLAIRNDDPFRFSLSGATSVHEREAFTLSLTPLSQLGLGGTSSFIVSWGDGYNDLVTASALQAAPSLLSHVYADDPNGLANLPADIAVVSQDALGHTWTEHFSLNVLDVAPQLDAFGATKVEHDAPYTLALGAYVDHGLDPMLGVTVDWGDNTQLTLGTVPASPTHSFAGLGTRQITTVVVNDDGSFVTDVQSVSVTAGAGHAPPNGTPGQWSQAWTDTLFNFSHRANAGEDWSPVTLGAVGSGKLAGGDIYGGLLGVSGQTAPGSSVVRQEIDGTEALRIALAPGHTATGVVLDLARLRLDDPGGFHEAGRVQLFNGNYQVIESFFRATQADGRLHLEVDSLAAFDSVVLTTGAWDAAGAQFVPGAMVDGQGRYLAAPAGAGSDYMLEAVSFWQGVVPAAAEVVGIASGADVPGGLG